MAFQVTDIIDRTSPLWQEFKAMPKIELHRHLEGAVRLETLLEVAREYRIDLPAYSAEELRPYVQVMSHDIANNKNFLSKFRALRQFFVSEDVIRRVAREAVEDAALDNIRYMELRFTPFAEAKLMNFLLYDVIDWISDEVQKTSLAHNIRVNLIIAMNRHESVSMGEAMLDAALHFRHRGVVGLDLCGNEVSHDAGPFGYIFKKAQDHGLGITIHAGEWMGPENVLDAIYNHGATRIGHGVRIVEDSVAVQYAKEHGAIFEVCPTSNLQTGVVGNLEHHPLIDLYFLKAKTTINTDDPTISGVTLTDEYALAVQGMGLPRDFVYDSIFNAVHAAFLPQDEREALEDEFRSMLGLDVLQPET